MCLITDLRKFREPILGTAVFDTGGTIIIGYMIAGKYDLSKPKTILGLLLLGHFVHVTLGIKTQLNDPREV